MLAYFFVSEHSQTDIYLGQVSSLPYLIQQCGGDVLRLKSETTQRLERYLNRYFDEVVVETDIPNEDTVQSKLELRVRVRVRDGGEQYSLSRLVQTMNGKVEKIIKVNNEG